jgi:transcriptional regulator with PAS, ATPase and Fis domain
VGGSTPISSDFRILTATNRNLEAMVSAGRFRQDLLYRLNIYTIEMPPLRDRKDDVSILAEYYLKRFAKRYRRPVEGISMDAMLFLREYPWPGNVRELVNAMERAVISCHGNLITLDHLPFRPDTRDCQKTRNMNLNDAEKFAIGMALRHTHGNKVQAADLLGINRTTLARKMQSYGMNGPDEATEA